MSHSELLRLLDKIGACHDAKVLDWRDTLKQTLELTEVLLQAHVVKYV